MKLCLYSD